MFAAGFVDEQIKIRSRIPLNPGDFNQNIFLFLSALQNESERMLELYSSYSKKAEFINLARSLQSVVEETLDELSRRFEAVA